MSEKAETREALQELVSTIYGAINTSLTKAKFDITKDAYITAVLANHYYQIKMDGTLYKIKGTQTDIFSVGDKVNILIPQNNYDNMQFYPSGGSSGTADLSNITWADLE